MKGWGKMEPVRTCIGCRQKANKSALVRVIARDGRVVVDDTATAPGRGAWLHPTASCGAEAIKRKALSRALKADITNTDDVATIDHRKTKAERLMDN